MTRALKTPISSAEDSHWEEDLIHLRIERRELRNRRESALTQSVENTALSLQRLSQTVAETNERHSRAIAALSEQYNAQVIERERAMLDLVKGVLTVMQEQTQSSSAAGEQRIKLMEHLVDKARSSHDWAGVVREVVTQGASVAQALIHPRQTAALPATQPQPATAISASTPRLLSPSHAPLMPAFEVSPVVTSPDPPEVADSDFLATFFGFSESPDQSVEPDKTEADATKPGVNEDNEGAAETPMAALPGVQQVLAALTGKLQNEDAVSDAGGDAAWPADSEGEAIDPAALIEMLSGLMVNAQPSPEPPRPEEWSRDWALKELKRRVLGLGEMGFVLTVTQPRRLLRFVRELGNAIRPPGAPPTATPS